MAALLTLAGGLSGYADDDSSGIPLSKAMKESASGSHEMLHGNKTTDTRVCIDANASTSVTPNGSSDGLTLVNYRKAEYAYQGLADTSFVTPFNGQIKFLNRITLTPVAFEDDYNYLGLFISGDIVELQPGSLPDRATDNVWMFELGLEYRRYMTPGHVFISPYLAVNASFQALNWDYRNPVYVDGSSVQSDTLEGMGGYIGFGVAFNRNSHLSFFGEAGFGGTAFLPQTNQGFDNDVFSNYGYFMIRAGLSLKF